MSDSIRVSPPPTKTVTYRYVALSSDNKLVRGTIKAATEALAGHLLVENGLRPVSLELLPSRFSLEQMFPSFFAVKPQEVPIFSRQLATLLEAGINILSALELIQQQVKSRAFKRVIEVITEDLRSGNSFSVALSKHPAVFDEIYSRTIAMAEQTGRLEVILKQMADFQEKQKAAMKKVKGALTYPAVMFCMGIVVAAILLSTALPAMIDMFETMKVDLPLPTRILIGISDIVHSQGKYIAVALAALVITGVIVIKRPDGRLWVDRQVLRAPVIGPPTHSAEIARFSRTASVLLGAGLSLQEIMEMIPLTVGNSAMRQSLTKVGQELVRGEGISEPMARDDLFPPLLTQMVMIGEESNTLDSSLAVAADYYENDSAEKINAMVKVIVPASTIFVALLVGFMALAVIMPMYSITGAF